MLRTSLSAALMAGVIAAGGCSSPPSCPPGAPCPATAPQVTFTPTINGNPAAPGHDGQVPSYRVRPGENLAIKVTVTVPEHVKITALWFGISTGTWGNGPKGPIGMNPVLTHYRQLLSAGSHTFGLRWRIPPGSPALLYLTFAWSSYQPSASVSGPVAQLILS